MNVDASWLKAAREEARRIAEEVLLNDAWRCMTMHDHALLQADACSGLEYSTEFTSSHLVLHLDIDIWIWIDLDWFGLIGIDSLRLKLIFEGATGRGKKISRGGWDQFLRSAGVPWGHVAVFAKPARVTKSLIIAATGSKSCIQGEAWECKGFCFKCNVDVSTTIGRKKDVGYQGSQQIS